MITNGFDAIELVGAGVDQPPETTDDRFYGMPGLVWRFEHKSSGAKERLAYAGRGKDLLLVYNPREIDVLTPLRARALFTARVEGPEWTLLTGRPG